MSAGPAITPDETADGGAVPAPAPGPFSADDLAERIIRHALDAIAYARALGATRETLLAGAAVAAAALLDEAAA